MTSGPVTVMAEMTGALTIIKGQLTEEACMRAGICKVCSYAHGEPEVECPFTSIDNAQPRIGSHGTFINCCKSAMT